MIFDYITATYFFSTFIIILSFLPFITTKSTWCLWGGGGTKLQFQNELPFFLCATKANHHRFPFLLYILGSHWKHRHTAHTVQQRKQLQNILLYFIVSPELHPHKNFATNTLFADEAAAWVPLHSNCINRNTNRYKIVFNMRYNKGNFKKKMYCTALSPLDLYDKLHACQYPAQQPCITNSQH